MAFFSRRQGGEPARSNYTVHAFVQHMTGVFLVAVVVDAWEVSNTLLPRLRAEPGHPSTPSQCNPSEPAGAGPRTPHRAEEAGARVPVRDARHLRGAHHRARAAEDAAGRRGGQEA
eukprot:7320294-Pyramimonas_sp.AAC.1